MKIELTFNELNENLVKYLTANSSSLKVTFLKYPEIYQYDTKSCIIDKLEIEVFQFLGLFSVNVKGNILLMDIAYNKEKMLFFAKLKINLKANIPFVSNNMMISAINKLLEPKLYIDDDNILIVFLQHLIDKKSEKIINEIKNVSLLVKKDKLILDLELV